MEDLVVGNERRLRAAGKRITPQRRLVLDVLSRAERHLDAHDIYEQGRKRDPHLSLSTVYRTLGALKETGLVRELHLDGEQHHYELDRQDEHSHLVCLSCGRVIEVDSDVLAQVVAAASESHDFEVVTAHVELVGYCASCRQGQAE